VSAGGGERELRPAGGPPREVAESPAGDAERAPALCPRAIPELLRDRDRVGVEDVDVARPHVVHLRGARD
jgi:hypothetical protein